MALVIFALNYRTLLPPTHVPVVTSLSSPAPYPLIMISSGVQLCSSITLCTSLAHYQHMARLGSLTLLVIHDLIP